MLFIALIVLIGIVVVWLMWAIFEKYYRTPEEIGALLAAVTVFTTR